MARLLTQLFEVTGQFDMATQPQLLLLQKTMVVVEGVARIAQSAVQHVGGGGPVVREWIETKLLGPEKRLAEAASGAAMLGRLAAELPEVLAEARRAAQMLSRHGGCRRPAPRPRDDRPLAAAQARHSRATR